MQQNDSSKKSAVEQAEDALEASHNRTSGVSYEQAYATIGQSIARIHRMYHLTGIAELRDAVEALRGVFNGMVMPASYDDDVPPEAVA